MIESKIPSAKGKTSLTSAGQAGFIVKSASGTTLGIDLYLSDCVEPLEGHDGYHRLMPKIINPKELSLDILIATHFHRDHFDVDAMGDLMNNEKTRLFCAYDCKQDVEDLKLEKNRVCFIKPGEKVIINDFKLHFINCDHGDGAPLAVGVIVEVDGKRILFTGDTCLRTDRKNEYLTLGDIDVLVAPINGAYGNLNEEENIELTKVINPLLTIPCHFGMFASHGGNPGLWRDLLLKELPNQNYKIFTMGEESAI